jgi:hypothetical protein
MPLPAILAAVLPMLAAGGAGAAAGMMASKGGSTGGVPGHVKQTPRYTPQQQKSIQSLLTYALSRLGVGPNGQQIGGGNMQGMMGGMPKAMTPIAGQPANYGAFNFAPIEAQARKNFSEKTMPSIAERFTAMGGQESSAFPQMLKSAGSSLDTNLAALGAQYGQQQQDVGLRQQSLGLGQQDFIARLLQMGLSSPFENQYFARQPGFGETAMQGVMSGIGYGLPSAIGSYFGASK